MQAFISHHRNSTEHLNCMKLWKELAVRIRTGEPIDKREMVLLDCILDINTEQLSFVIRVVSLMEKPQIREYFVGFLEAEDSTGQCLASTILRRFEELGIPFENCREQSYDNEANMKVKKREFKPGSWKRIYKISFCNVLHTH